MKKIGPFKYKKQNEELKRLINELFLIIDDYSDDLRLKNKQITNLESMIKSLKEDNNSILNEIKLKEDK